MKLQKHQFCIEGLTVLRNLSQRHQILLVHPNAGLKTQTLTKNVWAQIISAFGTQKFCSFWKSICPQILHPESWTFHQLLSFTSSLNVCCQFMSSVMPSLCKVIHVIISFSQICPGLNANEIQFPYDKHHKVSSLVKSLQDTHNSVKYEVIWKCQITLPILVFNPGHKCIFKC